MTDDRLAVLDLFSGIGGFSLGLERTGGFRTVAFCEIDPVCRSVLARHWPGVPIIADVATAVSTDVAAALICGGDPCPARSRARGSRQSRHADLAGWFLAVVARGRPRWVVRENVPAPDVRDFAAGLDALGYRSLAYEFDAADFTAQSRIRQFIIGTPSERAAAALHEALLDASDGIGPRASRDRAQAPIAACLTAHPMRMAAEDSYCFEPGLGLRILCAEEREALQGFPVGWTEMLAWRQRCRLIGNAVVPQVVELIGRAILEVEAGR